jgi:hypothetical protein
MSKIHQPTTKVFISSPSGMDSERAVVADEVEVLSARQHRKEGTRMSVIQWPNDIASGIADYGQAVINRQIDDYDILVCLIGTRLGTPTPRAASGTEEEFDRGVESVLNGQPRQILLFFDNRMVRPHGLDPHQLTLVRAFRDKAERLGVAYHLYNGHGELRRLLRTSLREAHDQIRAPFPRRRQHTAIVHATRPAEKSQLGDIALRTRSTAPQGADKYLIPLAAYRHRTIRVSGTLRTTSAYFRFGFKYFDSRERLLSPGSVQTMGRNIVVHIGKNLDRSEWFLTQYRAGYRLGANQPIAGTSNRTDAPFSIEVTSSEEITFTINDQVVFRGLCAIDGSATLALMGWSDEHDFVVDVGGLVIEVDSEVLG